MNSRTKNKIRFERRYLYDRVLTVIAGLLLSSLAFAAELPKLPELQSMDDDPLIYVTDIRLVDNAELANEGFVDIIANYENRYLAYSDIARLSQLLTQQLIDRGFVNSGVVIPDQEIQDSRVTLDVVPGILVSSEVRNQRAQSVPFVTHELAVLNEQLLDINILQQTLKVIEADERIEWVHAEVTPTDELGRAKLRVRVEEREPVVVSLLSNNYISPNVGSNQAVFNIRHLNLSGYGDTAAFRFAKAEGFKSFTAFYGLPVLQNYSVGLEYEHSESEVVTRPFSDLGIEGDSNRLNVSLNRSFIQSLTTEFSLGIALEHQEVQSYLLGEPFSFSATENNDPTRTTVFSFFQSWVKHHEDAAYSFYSRFDFGLDALGATVGGEADGEFITWLGQFSWVNRNTFLDSVLAVNSAIRISNDSLLGIDKFALGGVNSVRGYRESVVTRDNGLLLSLEWRVPLTRIRLPGLSRSSGDGRVELAPFYDVGWGSNTNDSFENPVRLSSAGMRIHWQLNDNSALTLHFARALENDIYEFSEPSLQDDGIHLELVVGLW